MPLPPALLAKLQKRGIVKTAEPGKFFCKLSIIVIFRGRSLCRALWRKERRKWFRRKWAQAWRSSWLPEQMVAVSPMLRILLWSLGWRIAGKQVCSNIVDLLLLSFRLSDRYNHARKMMLFKFPLTDEWKEVYDGGVKRHYYWNTYTDEVNLDFFIRLTHNDFRFLGFLPDIRIFWVACLLKLLQKVCSYWI